MVLESNVKDVLGSSNPPSFASFAFVSEDAAIMLVATCNSGGFPLEDDDPTKGISFRAWKFLGLRPRTTMGAVEFSEMFNFVPFANVPMTFKCSVKCCCNSRLRPLFAVAILNCNLL